VPASLQEDCLGRYTFQPSRLQTNGLGTVNENPKPYSPASCGLVPLVQTVLDRLIIDMMDSLYQLMATWPVSLDAVARLASMEATVTRTCGITCCSSHNLRSPQIKIAVAVNSQENFPMHSDFLWIASKLSHILCVDPFNNEGKFAFR
jgi:hypothetical protein